MGSLRWFRVVCGGLWWFAVVCGNSNVPLISLGVALNKTYNDKT